MRLLALILVVLTTFGCGGGSLVPASMSITAQPSSAVSGATLTPAPSVTVLNASGEPVADGVVVTVSLPSPTGGTLSGRLAVTTVAGVATFTDLTVDRAGPGYQLIFACEALEPVTSEAFDISVGPASALRSRMSVGPSGAIADGITAATITGVVQDEGGNPVVDQRVELRVSGTGGQLSGAAVSTDGNGIFAATLTSVIAETKDIVATVGTFTLTGSVTFVAGEPSGANSELEASPKTVAADGSTTTTLTLTVRDANDNLIAGHVVGLNSTGTNNDVEPPSGVTDENGVFTATLSSTKAEVKTVTADLGTGTTSTTVTFKAGAPSSANSSLVASPTSVTADGFSNSFLEVTVVDAHGNPVEGRAVTLSATGTGNTFSPEAGTTDASGRFWSNMRSTKAEVKTVTATFGSASASAEVTFVPSPASAATSTLTASPTSVTANGTATTTLTLTVRDASGNPIADKPVTLSASGTNNTLSPTSGTTNASGVFTATLASTTAETKTVTANASPITETASVTFTAGPATVAASSLVASPTSVEGNGTATSTLTLTLRDVNNNVVSGEAVTVAATGTGNTLTPASGTTNGSGVFTATIASTVAEAKTVTATFTAGSLDTTVTFTASANATNSSLVASTSSVVADGVATTTLTVTVRDDSNNPIAGYGVSLSATGAQNTFTPSSGVTDGSGVFQATLASTRAESKTVTATLGSINLDTDVTFTPGPAVGATSTITGTPSAAIADGVATIALTVTARDANGNTVPGATVVVTSSGTNNTFTPDPAEGTTDGNGEFSATLASTTSEAKTVSALVNGSFSVSTDVTFGASVLLVAADYSNDAADVKARLEATGAFTTVDVFNANAGTPTLAQLEPYSSVLVWSYLAFNSGTTLGNNLADYVDGGGRVVVAVFGYYDSSSYLVGGRWVTGNYNLFSPATFNYQSASLGTVSEPTSPLMTGVTSLSGTSLGYVAGTAVNGGVVVASWSSGQPLVIRGEVNGRNRVDLNLFPPSSSAVSGSWTGDGANLIRNALLY